MSNTTKYNYKYNVGDKVIMWREYYYIGNSDPTTQTVAYIRKRFPMSRSPYVRDGWKVPAYTVMVETTLSDGNKIYRHGVRVREKQIIRLDTLHYMRKNKK